jgi:hypothetical protein
MLVCLQLPIKCTPGFSLTIELCPCGFAKCFRYPSLPPIQVGECHMWSYTEACFSLDVPPLMRDTSLDIGIWESSFHCEHLLKSLDQEDRGMKSHPAAPWETVTFHRVKWTYHWKEKLQGKPGRIPFFQLSRYSVLFFDIEALIIVFLCSPSFHKSWNEISFKEGGL